MARTMTTRYAITSEYILNSNRIENVRNPAEHWQSLLAWEYLIDKTRLTLDVVLNTHKIIMQNLWPSQAGHLRLVNVEVGGRGCPHHANVPELLDKWLREMTQQLANRAIVKKTPQEMHVEFEHIHPFRDGNGRSGRMFMWWHEIQIGEKPSLIKYDERSDYYEWF